MNHLLAIGGAHIDRRGQVAGGFVPGASNPGTMGEEVGGGVFNAIRHAVRRGVSASLLSVRGGDAAGECVSSAIAEAGISDLSAVFLDRATPSYTALLDRHGDVIAALADMALYELAFPRLIRRAKVRDAIADADMILCDANLPTSALQRLMTISAGKQVFAIAISPAKVVRLSTVLPSLGCLFMNGREAAALARPGMEAPGSVVERLRQLGLTSGVISGGAEVVTGFDASGVFTIKPPAPREIADVTGAGDALAGGTVAAMMRGLPLRHALREGMAAAMLTLESRSSAPDYSASQFADALSLVPDAREMR